MKKLLGALLVVIAVLSITVGCSKKIEEQIPETQTVEETKSTQESQDIKPQEVEEEKESLSNIAVANYAFDRKTFPVMDGSTSMVPLGKAIASVLLGEDTDAVSDLVDFHKTTQSFRNLKDGLCDILIVGEPNAAVFTEMEEAGFDYELEEIATDALIFVVNKDNPVDDLTTDQIRDIYAGEITNWKEVGGNDAPIVAFQRNEGAGSQALIKKLIMKDTDMIEAPSTLIASEMGELMESVRSYDNSANAIGYSVYYYANDMKKAEGLKLISVDGVEPNSETIRSRKYPHLNAYYCVIDEHQPKDSPSRIMFEWLMSKDGQTLIDAEGYVTTKDPSTLKAELSGGKIVKTDYTYYRKLSIPENKYTRLSDGKLDTLKASEDYGFIYPYSGSKNFVNDDEGYAYEVGASKGFFDEHARLITDPIYNDITALAYYDDITDSRKNVPIWVMSRAIEGVKIDPNEEEYVPATESSFATMDGCYVCNKWYRYIDAYEDRIICRYIDDDGFDVYDLKGNKILSSDQVELWRNEDQNNGWSMAVSYGDGLYSIDVSEDETYYFDETGKTVLGPYKYGLSFSHDRASAKKAGTSYDENSTGIIDKKGNWIVEPKYSYSSRLGNGNLISGTSDNKYDVFDSNGKYLRSVEARYINTTNYGFSAFNGGHTDESEDHMMYFDFDGNLIFDDVNNEWEETGKDGMIHRTMGAGVQIKNIITDKIIYVEGACEVMPFYNIDDTPNIGRLRAFNYYYDQEEKYYYSHERVYDNDFNKLFDKQDVSLDAVKDEYCNDWYLVHLLKGNKVCISDVDCKELCTIEGLPQIVNGKFITSDEYACTCYDKNGEIVFSYSLVNSLGD